MKRGANVRFGPFSAVTSFLRQPGERPAGYRPEDRGLPGEPASIGAGGRNAGHIRQGIERLT